MIENKIKAASAKGRPLLYWVGKKPLEYIKGFPAQLVEVFDPQKNAKIPTIPNYKILKGDWCNLLFHGDNKDVLSTLLEKGFRGKVDMIYIDPPFMSRADYVRKVQLRGVKTLGAVDIDDADMLQQVMYEDMWKRDEYFQFIYERLMLLKELLSETGSIYVHLDWHVGHYVKLLMDEVFGQENFRNEIIWKRLTYKQTQIKGYGVLHDTILYYTKSDDFVWNDIRAEYDEKRKRKYFCWVETPDGRNIKLNKKQLEGQQPIPEGRRFATNPLLNLNPDRPHLRYNFLGFTRTWKYTKEKMMGYYKKGIVFQPSLHTLPQRKQYLDESEGMKLNDIWADIGAVMGGSNESLNFQTQKPTALIERIIKNSSNPGDLILDCFIGSGTTAVAAQKLGRRWIGCDINKGAIQLTSKRLQGIILKQLEDKNNNKQKILEEKSKRPFEYYYSFGVYKVNDYDLKLLKTEAMELAAQHIGIQRTRTDTFFDGYFGENLVKIIDFNHPLTLLGLQLIQDEIGKRPNEERDITVVCLGKELTVDPRVDEWNRKHPVNKIHPIELKTDKKYGNFLIHKPAEAKVNIERIDKTKAKVILKNFISPTIIERLNIDNKLFKVKIPDFRSMIDTVLIDSNYDGKKFHIVYSDVPEKKDDLVKGEYEIEILKSKISVAVKIIDMLGEEVLITEKV